VDLVLEMSIPSLLIVDQDCDTTDLTQKGVTGCSGLGRKTSSFNYVERVLPRSRIELGSTDQHVEIYYNMRVLVGISSPECLLIPMASVATHPPPAPPRTNNVDYEKGTRWNPWRVISVK
jgi:hypothetical protein